MLLRTSPTNCTYSFLERNGTCTHSFVSLAVWLLGAHQNISIVCSPHEELHHQPVWPFVVPATLFKSGHLIVFVCATHVLIVALHILGARNRHLSVFCCIVPSDLREWRIYIGRCHKVDRLLVFPYNSSHMSIGQKLTVPFVKFHFLPFEMGTVMEHYIRCISLKW